MTTVSIAKAEEGCKELAQQVEQGETVTVPRGGRPVLFAVPREVVTRKMGGLDLEALHARLRSSSTTDPIPYMADDFDDPLPEDFCCGLCLERTLLQKLVLVC